MNPPEPRAELLDLCNSLLDGRLTEAGRDRLEHLVLTDRQLRQAYVEHMHLHASLRQNASRLADLPLSEVLRTLPEEPARNVIRFPSWALRVAAAVAITFAVWWFAPQRPPSSFATLVETTGARWENSSLPTALGSPLGAGRLRLSDGIARLRFQSGTEVSLEGPAELELTGPNACFLHSGALVADVPVPGRGFVVGTANAKLIDHGTRFGISADAAGRAQVQVLQGEVELQHEQSGERLRLLTKESAAVTAERFTQEEKTSNESDRYAFLRTQKTTDRPVVTITSAGGRGDAGYVVSPNSRLHFSDTLLLLKNTASETFQRKAYLRFDLASLRDRKVTDASLTLNFEATGFGYASLTGECTFAVYGLTDDSQDAWSSDTLTWHEMPAYSPDPGSVDQSKAVRLGTFTMPKGVVSGVYRIEGSQLAHFLNADPNRLATLIVVRETAQPVNNTAVHGFAGNRHPTLAPPTLRLTIEEQSTAGRAGK